MLALSFKTAYVIWHMTPGLQSRGRRLAGFEVEKLYNVIDKAWISIQKRKEHMACKARIHLLYLGFS